ncbi:MAG: hypothetical protein V4712_13945 [Pseudomonadota bacterium]
MGFTPRLERLAIRLTTPARFFAGLAVRDWRKAGAAGALSGPADGPFLPPISDLAPPIPACLRIAVPLFRTAPQVAAWAQVVAVHKAMADAGRWPDLLAALRAADQSRVTMEGGKRIVDLVSEGARAGLAAAIARQDFTAASHELDRIATGLGPHAQDYAAAHLLAQAHLDLGWALREAGRLADQTGALTCAGWAAYRTHVAAAEAALGDFDPLELLSPLLAGTRYLLVRGLDDGEDLCHDWYEDWSDLDPTNWAVHATHAPQLLPNWFGSKTGFDAEARLAMARTEEDMGAAAYAMFYRAVADVLGDMPAEMDLGLLVQGLRDLADQTGCQYRANIVAGVLTELAHALHLEGPGAEDRFALVRQALEDVVTTQLREFHLTAWENGDDSIRWALAQVFGARLTPAARVIVGKAGLALTHP